MRTVCTLGAIGAVVLRALFGNTLEDASFRPRQALANDSQSHVPNHSLDQAVTEKLKTQNLYRSAHHFLACNCYVAV